MENLIGKITAALLENEPDRLGELVAKLNHNINPPEAVQPDDVHIRAMYIVSDKVNSFGGCFPPDEHEHLLGLLIDSPVLIGHRKDSLPIARNFHAEVVRRGDTQWIKVYFYWLKKSEWGEELQKNIDGGIYKECSISFIFGFPECSICGGDIRECRHRPFATYDVNGSQKEAWFNYRKIEKVLETSLVYRGSVENTAITKELAFSKEAQNQTAPGMECPQNIETYRIWKVEALRRAEKYLVMPAYESIPVKLVCHDGDIILRTEKGELKSERLTPVVKSVNVPSGDHILEGALMGLRGKERQSPNEIKAYLAGKKSTVRRLDLKVIDLLRRDGKNATGLPGRDRRRALVDLLGQDNPRLVPAEEISGVNLAALLGRLTTRYGALISSSESQVRYLLTRRPLVTATVIGREEKARLNLYRVALRRGSRLVPVKEPVTSSIELEEGEMAELEVYSLSDNGQGIKMVHPQIITRYHCAGPIDDISLLLQKSVRPFGQYEITSSGHDAVLRIISDEPGPSQYRLHNFSMELLSLGRRFLADGLDWPAEVSGKKLAGGEIVQNENINDCTILELAGDMPGKFILRKAIFNKSQRWLFYHAAVRRDKGEE